MPKPFATVMMLLSIRDFESSSSAFELHSLLPHGPNVYGYTNVILTRHFESKARGDDMLLSEGYGFSVQLNLTAFTCLSEAG